MMNKETKTPHIFVATPMYGGMCTGFYTQSIMLLQKRCAEENINITFSFMFNESLITRARNGMAHEFLKTDCTHLLFIDADIRFWADHLFGMLAANKDIICGIYPKKEINWDTVKIAMENGVKNEDLRWHTGSFVVNLYNYSGAVTVPLNKPVEIYNGGTGFMLIKRKVFDKLKKKVPFYTNNVVNTNTGLLPEKIYEYFATSIDDEVGVLLSEDYHFCKIARKNGIKVWAAPWVSLAHVGTYCFEGQLTPAP
jgi:hypothetical protein